MSVKELVEAIKELIDRLNDGAAQPQPIPVRVKDRPRRR